MSEQQTPEFSAESFRETMRTWFGDDGKPAFVDHMQLGRPDKIERGRVTQNWEMVDWARNPDGSLFGGYTAALLDQITALAAFTMIQQGEFIKTTQLQVDFHRPVHGPEVEIIGEVVNESRNAIHIEARIVNPGGKIAARGRAIYARRMISG